MPKFFLVHSRVVSETITREHQDWLNKPRPDGKTVMDADTRKFRIDLSDPNGFENNWELLDL